LFQNSSDAGYRISCRASSEIAHRHFAYGGGKAVTLHSGNSEYAIYTAAADQKELAEAAIRTVSEWELANTQKNVRRLKAGKAQ
jgi:hypothetical protein